MNSKPQNQPIVVLKKILWNLFSFVLINYRHPTYIYPLYFFSKKYINFYENNENCNMGTNGEKNFIDNILLKIKPQVIFDVGSNKGDYSKLIKNKFSKAELHCFEPDPSVFSLLKKNLNLYNNIHFNNIGISDKKERSLFFINKDNPELNSMYDMNTVGYDYKYHKIYINTDTLDNYCQKNNISNIDLLKIDVEGNEIPVLKGSSGLLKNNNIKVIQFEYGNASIASKVFIKDFIDIFSKYHYSVHKIMHNKLLKINYSPFMEGVSYANFVAFSNKVKINKNFFLTRYEIY